MSMSNCHDYEPEIVSTTTGAGASGRAATVRDMPEANSTNTLEAAVTITPGSNS